MENTALSMILPDVRLRGLLFLRHGALSSSEGHSRIALGYFTFKALLGHPLHAIVVRLWGHFIGYVGVASLIGKAHHH